MQKKSNLQTGINALHLANAQGLNNQSIRRALIDKLAPFLVYNGCRNNSGIEDIHSAKCSDGHPLINDEEMKNLMIGMTNFVAEYLDMIFSDPEILANTAKLDPLLRPPYYWQSPDWMFIDTQEERAEEQLKAMLKELDEKFSE